MNQYCYNIINSDDNIKEYIQNIYKKKKFKDLAFIDEELPFIVIYSEKDNQVCIKLTSRAKKTIERIESIHNKLTDKDLNNGDISLEPPFLFTLEQCAWWDKSCIDKSGVKWTTLEHNGPYFTHLYEPYEPHGAPIIYDGKKYPLTPNEERIANFYARRIISEASGNVAQIWTKDKVFNTNFWTDYQNYLSPEHKKIFKDFSKLNFDLIVKKLEELKEEDKSKDKIDKKIKLAEKKQNYGYAIINGVRELLGNFTIEPAAIFYGRGDNPMRGKIKRDIEPEEVTINIGEKAKIPIPPKGHKWDKVIHDHTLSWIASWKDSTSGENKYVYFSAEGQLKGKSDFVKYEKARKLNKYLDIIRDRYTNDIKSNNTKLKQLATVLYLIDNYGIRVGNEKDESETDTVGATTLRVEHIKLIDPNKIVFDFLGKDSIRYYKELVVPNYIYNNFKLFIAGKKKNESLFDLISAIDINSYLKTFDKDFSAKVFRTRLASTLMNDSLKKLVIKKNATIDDLKALFVSANSVVANVLNHQRTASTKAQEAVEKYKDELKELKTQLKNEEEGKKSDAIKKKINKLKNAISSKEDTMSVAITTSLTNYIDPRMVVSWANEHEVPLNKIYSGALMRKFKWAIDITEDDWEYNNTELIAEMAELEPYVEKGRPSISTITKDVDKPVEKVIKKVIKPTEQILDKPINIDNIKIVDYSDKAIVVLGDTKPIKEALMKLGGKFNPNLTVNGSKVAGWIFSKTKKTLVEEYIKNPLMVPESKTIDELKLVETSIPIKKSIIQDFSNSLKIVDYSDKAIVVLGDTKPIKEVLMKLGGKFNPNLTVNGSKVAGWIFSKTKKTLVEEYIKNPLVFPESKIETVPESIAIKSVIPVKQSIIEEFPNNIKIVDYSDKAIVVLGDTKSFKEELMKLGGKFNPNLTVNGSKVAGWIFSKKASINFANFFNRQIKPTDNPIAIIKYKDNLAVIGDIKNYAERFSLLGGKKELINLNDKKIDAWIFNNNMEEELKILIKLDIPVKKSILQKQWSKISRLLLSIDPKPKLFNNLYYILPMNIYKPNVIKFLTCSGLTFNENDTKDMLSKITSLLFNKSYLILFLIYILKNSTNKKVEEILNMLNNESGLEYVLYDGRVLPLITTDLANKIVWQNGYQFYYFLQWIPEYRPTLISHYTKHIPQEFKDLLVNTEQNFTIDNINKIKEYINKLIPKQQNLIRFITESCDINNNFLYQLSIDNPKAQFNLELINKFLNNL
jgi:DNA topoisomerase I